MVVISRTQSVILGPDMSFTSGCRAEEAEGAETVTSEGEEGRREQDGESRIEV